MRTRNVKKKEYFTFYFLLGPNSRVRVMKVSRGVIKTIFFSLAMVLLLSLYLAYDYNDMKDKIYEYNYMKGKLQAERLHSYLPAAPEPVNFTPLLYFMGFMALAASIFFTITKVMRIIASSRAAAIKNKLIEDFCSALDNSSLKPSTSQGSNYDRKQ